MNLIEYLIFFFTTSEKIPYCDPSTVEYNECGLVTNKVLGFLLEMGNVLQKFSGLVTQTKIVENHFVKVKH